MKISELGSLPKFIGFSVGGVLFVGVVERWRSLILESIAV